MKSPADAEGEERRRTAIRTNKLCNPTHKDVKFPYDRGVNLKIPADSFIELTMEQEKDFANNLPGSEEARQILDYHGLFMLDGDRSYEEQALESLRKTVREKKAQLDNFVDRIRAQGTATGATVSDENLEDKKYKAGYKTFEEDLKVLEARVKYLSGVLTQSGFKGKVKAQLDPRRTCFATKPPREFPSEVALEMFLVGKPEEFVSQHRELQAQMLQEG